ncbi:hypothetical protein YC2023_076527 [Brassica napus]
MGNKSGYGSEPGYRGDVEFGYGDEYDDEEENVKLLFWGDCLGRRLGPSFLGRVDDSERLARDFYTILNEVSTQEIPDGLKIPDSFKHLVSDMKNNHYDAKTFALVLRAISKTDR